MASISKRASGAWQNTSYGIRATATDTITTLPTTIYGDGTNATITIKGNTVQSGTPTPDNPIMPQGCGALESGQYKIPISSAGQTNNIYLGEVESTRKIKKIVFFGSEDENWSTQGAGAGATRFRYTLVNSVQADTAHLTSISTHLILGVEGGTWNTDNIYTISSNYLWLRFDSSITTVAALKTWLAQQYANGTPFTVYYTLATPETAVVNEPLMKIDGYADEVSGVSIPTTDGANTLSVDTTVQPSEVSVNYHGWHMGTVHERISGEWD